VTRIIDYCHTVSLHYVSTLAFFSLCNNTNISNDNASTNFWAHAILDFLILLQILSHLLLLWIKISTAQVIYVPCLSTVMYLQCQSYELWTRKKNIFNNYIQSSTMELFLHILFCGIESLFSKTYFWFPYFKNSKTNNLLTVSMEGFQGANAMFGFSHTWPKKKGETWN
jgi:hypothetical protein